MNALKFSVLVLADEIAAGSIGLSPLDAVLVFWHGSSPTVEYHLLQVRRPGAVKNCKILLLSCNNEITKIQAFRRGLQYPHPYQSPSQPIAYAPGLSKAAQQLLLSFGPEASEADPISLIN